MVTRAFFLLTVLVCAGAAVGLGVGGGGAVAGDRDPNLLAFDNDFGQLRTLQVDGAIDLENPFFQDLGSNGRRCVSCHQPDSAWTITPANVQRRFAETGGTDPIFTNSDGSNCEAARPESIAEKQAAYSLLLTRGLIRVGASSRGQSCAGSRPARRTSTTDRPQRWTRRLTSTRGAST